MTEAGWTSEKPTKNGWYWWRFDASASATIVRIMVCGDGSLAEMSNNGHLLLAANFGGEWLGPLSPNDYQQGRVAGLREAANEMCYLIAQYGAGVHAINLFGEWLKEQTRPQAAQDEKGVGDGNIKMS